MKRLLFSIHAYKYLEAKFLEHGDFDHGTVQRKQFPDGERYLRIADDPRGRDVVLLGGTPSDPDALELYDLGCAIARAGARSLSIVIPYFGYATMERAVLPGEVVTAKTRAGLISAIPVCEAGTQVILFDLHTDGIEFYFSDSHVTRHVYGAPIVVDAVKKTMGAKKFVLGATDAGRAKWVQSLASRLGVEPAFCYKRRDAATGEPRLTGINADVSGVEVMLYDDMIRTGSSLLQAARAYLGAGATKVHAIASHLVLPGDSLAKLQASGVLGSILGSDSHPASQKLSPIEGAVFSVAPLLVRKLDEATR
jgi:ribose-phosphate pyrophosphokinase